MKLSRTPHYVVEVVERVVKEDVCKTVDRYNLTLDRDELQVLRDLLGHIGGDPDKSRRKHLVALSRLCLDLGIHYNSPGDIVGTIQFHPLLPQGTAAPLGAGSPPPTPQYTPPTPQYTPQQPPPTPQPPLPCNCLNCCGVTGEILPIWMWRKLNV